MRTTLPNTIIEQNCFYDQLYDVYHTVDLEDILNASMALSAKVEDLYDVTPENNEIKFNIAWGTIHVTWSREILNPNYEAELKEYEEYLAFTLKIKMEQEEKRKRLEENKSARKEYMAKKRLNKIVAKVKEIENAPTLSIDEKYQKIKFLMGQVKQSSC